MSKKEDIKKYIRLCFLTPTARISLIQNWVKTSLLISKKEKDVDQVTDVIWEKVTQDEYIEKFVDSFDKIFSHEEIKYFLEFYTSEACKKYEEKGKTLISDMFEDIRKLTEKELS